MKEPLVAGEVVSLNSGGPPMTVDAIAGEDVTCVWFSAETFHRETFSKNVVARLKNDPLMRMDMAYIFS